MIGWKEQEPETVYKAPQTFSRQGHFKACCNLFWYGLKSALLIPHTSTLVDPLI